MQTSSLALVTGANGHLGNNIARELLHPHVPVRAGVRHGQNPAPFAGLDCERVPLDITNPAQGQLHAGLAAWTPMRRTPLLPRFSRRRRN
jgi:dihydroflavonol-4-reductase